MYILSSGNSVVSELSDTNFKVSNDDKKAISFDTIGEAMRKACIVNNLIGKPIYRVFNIL